MNNEVYAIHPGVVRGKDGDRHYISYGKLIELYCLDPHQCVNFEREENKVGWRGREIKHIYPSPAGNYPIFKEKP